MNTINWTAVQWETESGLRVSLTLPMMAASTPATFRKLIDAFEAIDAALAEVDKEAPDAD